MIDVKAETRRVREAEDALETCRRQLAVAQARAWTLSAVARDGREALTAARSASADAVALQTALAEVEARAAAMDTVIDCLAASLGTRSFDRRAFTGSVQRAARDIPNEGPQAVKHEILLKQTRKVLHIQD